MTTKTDTHARRCLSKVGGEEGVDAEGREYVTAGIHAPSIFAWAVAHGWHKPDTDRIANVIASCWGLPHEVAVEIVTKKRPYEVDPADQAVIVRY
ncbi:hypothetical protein [Bradyrhizobium sp. AZCC 2289]|uniref:hypothetical protein n=1 Tax=Bradyrhizobium sp. AZCC 2289 TaxID=3117026 RepID=UPI002FEF9D65